MPQTLQLVTQSKKKSSCLKLLRLLSVIENTQHNTTTTKTKRQTNKIIVTIALCAPVTINLLFFLICYSAFLLALPFFTIYCVPSFCHCVSFVVEKPNKNQSQISACGSLSPPFLVAQFFPARLPRPHHPTHTPRCTS